MTIKGRAKKDSRLMGYTLAESLMAIIVLAIAAAGVLLPYSQGAAVQAEGTRRTVAAALCHDLLEEIAAADFEQIITEYDAYSEAEGQIKDAAGQVLSGPAYEGLSRQVSCSYVKTAQQSAEGDAVFILATVTVFHRGNELASISRLIGK